MLTDRQTNRGKTCVGGKQVRKKLRFQYWLSECRVKCGTNTIQSPAPVTSRHTPCQSNRAKFDPNVGLPDFLQQNTGDLSIRDVRQGQYDAFSCLCVCLFMSIVTMAVSVAVYEIFSAKDWCDLENRDRVRSRSLEMASFDRSHTSSYSPFIVTMAVSSAISEIFSVKEWPDLEMWVWCCSRSLKMARFDRPCMTFY